MFLRAEEMERVEIDVVKPQKLMLRQTTIDSSFLPRSYTQCRCAEAQLFLCDEMEKGKCDLRVHDASCLQRTEEENIRKETYAVSSNVDSFENHVESLQW